MPSHPDFDPNTNIPDLGGKVVLVTGGNSGLGEATIAALAPHNPAKIYLGSRSRAKGLEAVQRIHADSPQANIEVLEIDLASLKSVKAAAERVNAEVQRLDLLFLNGGISAVPPAVTADGYEIQFGTNYMGHAMLTQLLMPKLLSTTKLPGTDVRIVAMSSVGHNRFNPASPSAWDLGATSTDGRAVGGFGLYGQSMLSKTLFAHQLAMKFPQITTSSLHPGTVVTNVWQGDKSVNWLFLAIIRLIVSIVGVSSEEGAKGQLWCAFSKDVVSGNYYEPVGKAGKQSNAAYDVALGEMLWTWTEGELKKHGGSGWMI